jgi:hypothetical protein
MSGSVGAHRSSVASYRPAERLFVLGWYYALVVARLLGRHVLVVSRVLRPAGLVDAALANDATRPVTLPWAGVIDRG